MQMKRAISNQFADRMHYSICIARVRLAVELVALAFGQKKNPFGFFDSHLNGAAICSG